jgi:capsule polysaccharide export protein KpsE/RkpR
MVMMEIGAARSRAELVKLQVTYKEVLLRNQADAAKAQLVVRDLARQHEELGAQLDEERTLNDANATRLKELKQTVEAVERSLAWMKKQRAA